MQRKQHKKYERPSSCGRRHFLILFMPSSTGPQWLLGGVHCTIRNESANHSYSHIVKKKKAKQIKKPSMVYHRHRAQLPRLAPQTHSGHSITGYLQHILILQEWNKKKKKKGKWGTFMSNLAQGLIFCISLCKIAPMQQVLEISEWCSARAFLRWEKRTWGQIGRRRKHQRWNGACPKGNEGRRLENVSIRLG